MRWDLLCPKGCQQAPSSPKSLGCPLGFGTSRAQAPVHARVMPTPRVGGHLHDRSPFGLVTGTMLDGTYPGKGSVWH